MNNVGSFDMAREQFRECAILSLSQKVLAFAREGETWEIKFDSTNASLLRGQKVIAAVRIVNGTATATIHGEGWTQRDMQRWTQKYGDCLQDVAHILISTDPGETGMVTLY